MTILRIADDYTGEPISVLVQETREGDRVLVWVAVHSAGDDSDHDDAFWEIGLDAPGAALLAAALQSAALEAADSRALLGVVPQ